jgi:hypothetical protein
MEADESNAVSNILNFCKLSRLTPLATLSPLEGLELVQAFMQIQAIENRQKVIELAKRLSINAGAGHNAP